MTPEAGLRVIVLAAGKGVRMKSATPKVLHPVGGVAMLERVLRAARALGPAWIYVVVSKDREAIEAGLGRPRDVSFVTQAEPKGTGHAVGCAREAVLGDGGGKVLLLCGDTPRLTGATLARFWEEAGRSGCPAALVTLEVPDPKGYGRIVRDARGTFVRIVEEKDASSEQRAIREINAGVYLTEAGALFEQLAKVGNQNASGEYYLPDAFELMVRAGSPVAAIPIGPAAEFEGVNDRVQLAAAERWVRQQKAEALMRAGVTIPDPASVQIEDGVEVGQDSVISPGSILEGATRIGAGCRIGPYAVLRDARLADGVEVREFSVVEKAELAGGVVVGPFARLREGTVLGEKVRIGNFVETKKARIGKGAKANHLAYLGDCAIGAESNIGAGTITCNYDGFGKHHTEIGERVFVGSNSTLVAPVEVEADAYVAAGSVITRIVPKDALGIGRARQENKEGYAGKLRERFGGKGGKDGPGR